MTTSSIKITEVVFNHIEREIADDPIMKGVAKVFNEYMHSEAIRTFSSGIRIGRGAIVGNMYKSKKSLSTWLVSHKKGDHPSELYNALNDCLKVYLQQNGISLNCDIQLQYKFNKPHLINLRRL